MSKQQVIDEIRQHNRSAPLDFLVSFDQQVLENYLKRLALTRGARGRASVWVRPGDSAAAVTRVH